MVVKGEISIVFLCMQMLSQTSQDCNMSFLIPCWKRTK